MDFKERTKAIANLLRYCEEQYNKTSGIRISRVKDIFSRACDVFIMDSDIKYLFEKEYIEYFYDSPDMDASTYVKGIDLSIKVTAKGVKYLDEEKESKKIPPQMMQLIKDGMVI